MKKTLRNTNNSELIISHIFSYLEIKDKLIAFFNVRNSEKLKTCSVILNSQMKKCEIIITPKRYT